jgi:hypothetical protein
MFAKADVIVSTIFTFYLLRSERMAVRSFER